jgi:hypothetical protein
MKLIHIQGQFLSFLDTYSSRKLYFSENSLCDVISHRWYFHMKQSWISWKGSKLPKFYKRNYWVILSDLYNATINLWGKISCHRHFKNRATTYYIGKLRGFFKNRRGNNIYITDIDILRGFLRTEQQHIILIYCVVS